MKQQRRIAIKMAEMEIPATVPVERVERTDLVPARKCMHLGSSAHAIHIDSCLPEHKNIREHTS